MADTDTYEVTPKEQRVFHDGTSMRVLRKGEKVEVEDRFIAGLVADGVIDMPKDFMSLSRQTTTTADGFQSSVEEGVDTDADSTKGKKGGKASDADVPPA